MKRSLLIILLAIVTCFVAADAKLKPEALSIADTPPCAANLGVCQPTGCSPDNHHDPNLNGRKNILANNNAALDRTLTWMIQRESLIHSYQRGGPRNELTSLGEGTNARVVGLLLAVKQEHGESCNCYLNVVDVTTDNHLVLVNPDVIQHNLIPANANLNQLKAIFSTRERQSVTAEFTPRVRAQGHPNFTSQLQSIVDAAPQRALLVRITGQLMFDSEHFHHNPLNRATSWEIHPIMKLEFCPAGKSCAINSNANWVNLDSQ